MYLRNVCLNSIFVLPDTFCEKTIFDRHLNGTVWKLW